jgi:hypothetical protein
MRRRGSVIAAIVLSISLVGASAVSAGPLWEFTRPGNSFTNNNWVFATPFEVLNDVWATGLGYYADPNNGFVNANAVSLFECDNATCTGSGTLLASVTVDNTYALYGHFRYVTIPSLQLLAGHSYEVSGVSMGDNYTWNDTGFATDPNISLIMTGSQVGRWETGSSPIFLNYGRSDIPGQDGFWGPNVFIGEPDFTEPVPEPASMLLFGTGLVGLRAWRKRRG